MNFFRMFGHLKSIPKGIRTVQRGTKRLKKRSKRLVRRIKQGAISIGHFVRGTEPEPGFKKVRAYALLEKDVLKSPGDIFILPGTKGTKARVLSKKYQLVCNGRKSHDAVIIEYTAKGVKKGSVLMDAQTIVKMVKAQPPKAKYMFVYNLLQSWSKKLEIKPEF